MLRPCHDPNLTQSIRQFSASQIPVEACLPRAAQLSYMKASRAYVYAGEGAGRRSVLSAEEALGDALSGVQIRELGSAELLRGGWQEGCVLLCMPGGADLPYCRDLNGAGNALIKEYVRSGGSYLGLCAGAYYACSHIEFELGTKLEVRGARELAFFPGVARGAVYPGFAYQTEAGTRAAPLRFSAAEDGETWRECRDYSNGGPAFQRHSGDRDDAVEELAFYADGFGPAAVRCQVGNGVAVLCGTHPELAPRWLDGACSAAAVQAAHPECSPDRVVELVEIAKAAQNALKEDAGFRSLFWHKLLAEAGLGSYLQPP